MSEQNTSPDNIRGRGQPTKYREEYADLARKFCLLGADDERLARMFEVDVSTISNWKNAHPDFLEAIKEGKDRADAAVAHSLFHRAIGYSHPAVKIVADAKSGTEHIVNYTEHYPPDATSAIFWLKNRQGWRDKLDVENKYPIEELSDAQIQDRIALLQKVVLQKAESAQRNEKSSEAV